MTQILLIAWREYKQYVLSRGFLLFLVMFPLGFMVGGAAIGFAEQAKPARHFVVFDQSAGEYGRAIDQEIEDRRQRRILAAWDAYLEFSADPEALAQGLIPAPFGPAGVSRARLEAYAAAGGVAAAKKAAAPYLKEGATPFFASRKALVRIDAPKEVAAAQSLEEAADLLRPYLLEDKKVIGPDGPVDLFAALLIPRDFGAARNEGDQAVSSEAQYWSRNITDGVLRDAVSTALDSTLRRQLVSDYGLEATVLDDIRDVTAPIGDYRPDRQEDAAQLGLRDQVEIFLPAALTYMLVVIIFGVGNLLLTNTIEERSNKIVEVLLSSVTADQLMFGKLIGIGAVGLTLPSVFLVGGSIAALAVPASAELMGGVMQTLFATPLFAIYLFYFFCAYAIFAMIFLAIGAISNSMQDAQSYMGPVTLLMFAPLPFVMMVYQNPNGVVASVLTWIPIYTPYAVLMRAASDPPLWEIIGATAFMLVFAWALARVMGRIFRRALLQAAPPKAKDILKLAVRRRD